MAYDYKMNEPNKDLLPLNDLTLEFLIDEDYLKATNFISPHLGDSDPWAKIKLMNIREFFGRKGGSYIRGMGRVKMRKIVRYLVFQASLDHDDREWILDQWI